MSTPLIITSAIAILWPITALSRRFLKAHIARSVREQEFRGHLGAHRSEIDCLTSRTMALEARLNQAATIVYKDKKP